MNSNHILDELMQRYPVLAPLKSSIREMTSAIIETYKNGGKLLVCGNGGSSSDADHIVGELMKSFEGNRPVSKELSDKLISINRKNGKLLAENLQQGLPAISLSAHQALTTAVTNDINGEFIFAQQVLGYGKQGDVLLAFSTSGNSRNVINALIVAKALGCKTIGLTGKTGGEVKKYCDTLINVPELRTAYVQELHLPVYHAVCLMVEKEIFG